MKSVVIRGDTRAEKKDEMFSLSCQKSPLRNPLPWQSLLLITLLSSQLSMPYDYAAASNKKSKLHSPSTASTSKGSELLGLSGNVLSLVNRGKWSEVADALEGQTSATAGKPEVWLAFAYMYMNSCDKLKALNDRLGAVPSAEPDKKNSAKSQAAPVTQPTSTGAAVPAGTNTPGMASASSTATESASTTAITTTGATGTTTTTAATESTAPTSSTAAAAAASNTSARTTATATSTSSMSATTVSAGNVTPTNNVTKLSNTAGRYPLLISAFEKVCEGRVPEAAAILKRLPPDAVQDPVCLFAQAAIAGKQSRPIDAVNFCQTAVTIAPEFGWGFRTVGFLQERLLKQYALAEDSYAQALIACPEQEEAREHLTELKLSHNDFDGAIDVADDAIAHAPKVASNYFRLADIYTRQWRFREAEAQLDLAIKDEPDNAKYFRARASLKKWRGNIQSAIADQKKAVELSKEKAFELVELASLEELGGNPNRAADALEEALRTDPNNQLAHEKLIAILEREKRFGDLISELTKLVEKAPKNAKLHLRLAQVLLEDGKVEKAQTEFVNAANLDQNDPEPHRQMGALKIKLKEYEAAAKEYTAALNRVLSGPGALNSGGPSAASVPDLVSLGYCYAQNNDYMQAEAAFVTSLALQQLSVQTPGTVPDRLDVMRSLASLLLQEQRYSDAASQFESILAMVKPGNDARLDQFMLNRAKALRDLNARGPSDLMDSFKQMDVAHQDDQALHLAQTLLRLQKPELAKEIIAKHKPQSLNSDVDAEWLLSTARYDLAAGARETAHSALKKIIDDRKIAPSLRAQAHAVLAESELKSDELSAAEKDARAAIDIYSKDSFTYVTAARIAHKQKDYKLAEEFVKKALEQNPYDSAGYIVLGQIKIDTNDPKAAVTNLRKAEELYPSLLEPHKLLIETLPKVSQNDEAKKEQEQLSNLEKQQK